MTHSPLDTETPSVPRSTHDVRISRRALLGSTFALEVALLAVAVAVMYFADIRPALDMARADLLAGIVTGLVTATCAIALANSSAGFFRRIRQDFELFIGVFAYSPVLDLVIISLLAGVCEEALFRGLLQTWIGGWAGPATGIVLASILFGLTHAISVPYAVFATVLGLVLGYLYHASGSLLAAMLAHAIYDAVALYWGTRVLGPRIRAAADTDEGGA